MDFLKLGAFAVSAFMDGRKNVALKSGKLISYSTLLNRSPSSRTRYAPYARQTSQLKNSTGRAFRNRFALLIASGARANEPMQTNFGAATVIHPERTLNIGAINLESQLNGTMSFIRAKMVNARFVGARKHTQFSREESHAGSQSTTITKVAMFGVCCASDVTRHFTSWSLTASTGRTEQ
jgi:hypothetical protein